MTTTLQRLHSFLLQHKIQKGGAHTHTSIANPAGSFYVCPKDLPVFLELYQKAVSEGETNLHLTEKHSDVGPILIDLDFRFAAEHGDDEKPKRRYTAENITNVFRIYADTIANYIDEIDHFDVYVMEKPAPVLAKELEKDGIHLVIPDIVTAPTFQYMLRETVLPMIKKEIANLNLHNKLHDIVDEAVIEKNNWQMLGSRKPGCDAYKVTKVFRYFTEDGQFDELPLNPDMSVYVERLLISNKHKVSKFKREKMEEIRKYEDKIQKQKLRHYFKSTIISKTRNLKQHVTTEEDFKQAVALSAMLSKERAESYNDWIRVGWCLHNIDFKLLPSWIEFSKRSNKFNDGTCEKHWGHMKNDGNCLGMGTLHMWAKHDNPTEYNRIIGDELRTLIRESCNGSEYDVARVVQRKYNHGFAYDSGNKLWFHFYDHRWHLTNDGLGLKTKLPTEIATEYRKAVSYYVNLANMTEDSTQKEIYDELVTKLQSIVHKLKKASFQANVMTECAMLFNIEKFDEKLDSNTYLVGFDNGIFDLHAMEFRDGRPEDYVSVTTRINYVPLVDQPESVIQEIEGFLSQVLTIRDVREYVLRLFASFLDGAIKTERFNIWTGVGCFAKDTKVVMFDGTEKSIQDIGIGEQVMGDDNTPRNVKQLFRGHSDMYKIIPSRGDPFVVNGDHDLAVTVSDTIREGVVNSSLSWLSYKDGVLKSNVRKFAHDPEGRKAFRQRLETDKDNGLVKNGDRLVINMREILKFSNQLLTKEWLNIYRSPGVVYPEKEVKMDPYAFGYWLGDGHTHDTSITTADAEVVSYFQNLVDQHKCVMKIYSSKGKAATYGISGCEDGNFVLKALKHYNLYKVKNGKHIPQDYMVNTENVRYQVLAGILDSDGHYQSSMKQFELTLKSETLIDNVVTLARSLGLACYKKQIQKMCYNNGVVGTYYRLQIVGDNLHKIPTIIPRKRADARTCSRDPLKQHFKIERIDDGNYYGFELDNNHLFVMGGSYTIQSNSNGKSRLIELFQKSFGEYCCTLPIALLTQKRGASSAATPELARARGKRFACLQEPGENERLNIGLMKEMTGGDKIYARALYRDGCEFKPQFKMILTCNHLPIVPSDDGGTWRRIRVVKFLSRFCDMPNPNNPHEFPINTSLSSKFDEWAEVFMSMLVSYYGKMLTHTYPEPNEVLECTREYQRRNDILADYIDTHLCKGNGNTTIDSIYDDFKSWLKEEGLYDRGIRKSDLLTAVQKVHEKPVNLGRMGKGWRGVVLRNNVDEADDIDADDV
jgi:P4 family phage/plasmid primase-like protien